MIDTQALREKILDLAMRGKLVPQDPADEPARVLLDRIKAEKEELIKAKKIKRDKNESEIFTSGDGCPYEKFKDGTSKPVDVPYELPQGWEWGRIGSYLNVIMGTSPKGVNISEKSLEESIEFHQGKSNFGNKYLELSGKYTTQITKLINEPSIIMSVRAPVGDVNISNRKIVIGRGLASLLSLTKDLEYPYYFLKTQKSSLENQATGTTFKAINGDIIKNQLIPIPPLAEQERIVAKINQLFDLVDRIEREQKELQELSKQLKQKVLDVAMQGKLVPQDPTDEPASVLLEKIREEKQKLFEAGKIKKKDLVEVPISDVGCAPYGKLHEGWTISTLGQLGNWVSGTTPKRTNKAYYENATIPWLKTGDLTDGIIETIPEKISELAYQETSLKLIPANTVVIAMYGATIGKLGITSFETTTNQACCACINYNGISTKFLFYWLLAKKSEFIESAFGGAQPNISKEKIVSKIICLPPAAEQSRIVQKLNQVNQAIEKLG